MQAYHKYLLNDGIELFTVVCLPAEKGKFPTVIYRTPYVDESEMESNDVICEKKLAEWSAWTDAGYAVVFQHCRGKGKSTGDFIPHVNERTDGLALQAWIREQSFYNGELYLLGGSYNAYVHFATAPFADDIKGAVLEVSDCERYNWCYRNGFYKIQLIGNWYVKHYKKKSNLKKSFTIDSYRMLPLSDFSKTVFDEHAEVLDEIFKHPKKDDEFWNTDFCGANTRDAIKHTRIPILLTTGFYDIFTGGVFDMWRGLDDRARSVCALAVHPFNHSCNGNIEPINFENGTLLKEFENYKLRWFESIRKNVEPPFESGKVTYYKLFDGKWCCDDFYNANETKRFTLGEESVTYKYNPYAPARVNGGLSTNFDGNAWQIEPNSRYDVISVFTPEFEEDTYIKGKITAKLKVSSDCEDTCFYMRLSIPKEEGYYGLRDDINQISNFDAEYKPNSEIEMSFSFDEHAFVVKKGERLRIDISSSAYPNYVPHTNQKGLFSENTTARVATNTVYLQQSYIELPIRTDF